MLNIISIIGYSNSGKTNFIEIAIKRLKKQLNKNCAVIKFIHEHKIDIEGKDTYRFKEAGALLAITQNSYSETTIFLKNKLSFINIIKWLEDSPFNINLIFIESFRDKNFPTILCVKDEEEIKPQLNENIKAISGLICTDSNRKDKYYDIPLINIETQFSSFLEIFDIT
ncbi:MAG: molybdopterin-guanine dinucleotide biosynthesis protein B [Candidatus Lokiarchaeota archaeon]|nr:molybdopterin-guanine dinucleotide biosynthesis protein B [Candidatus Lokiarchaeota archaeon]